MPFLAHAPLEPLNAIVKDGRRLDVWVATRCRASRSGVAAVTGLKTEQVRFHQQYAGGSFGHRLEFENVTLARRSPGRCPACRSR